MAEDDVKLTQAGSHITALNAINQVSATATQLEARFRRMLLYVC